MRKEHGEKKEGEEKKKHSQATSSFVFAGKVVGLSRDLANASRERARQPVTPRTLLRQQSLAHFSQQTQLLHSLPGGLGVILAVSLQDF